MKFSKVKDISDIYAKGQRSRSQRSKQILSEFGHFQTVTPAWIHIWLRDDTQSYGGIDDFF